MKKAVFLAIAMSSSFGAAFAGDVTPKTAKSIYLNVLKNAQPENDGDGALHKTGSISCTEAGNAAPFTYSCEGLNSAAAKDVYLNGLREMSAGNDGDGILSKSAYVTCFELGEAAPFSYSCAFFE